MDPVTASIVAAFVIQGVSSYMGGKAKAKEAKRLAAAREQQAQEILARSEFNILGFKKEADKFKGRQIAASSLDVGGGNVLMSLEDTNMKLQEAIGIERRNAQYDANTLRLGGQLAVQEANDIRKAFIPNLAASGVQAYGQNAAYKKGY